MIVLGGLTYAGLEIAGVGFAAFFATFTAVAMIIPYFGALISSIRRSSMRSRFRQAKR